MAAALGCFHWFGLDEFKISSKSCVEIIFVLINTIHQQQPINRKTGDGCCLFPSVNLFGIMLGRNPDVHTPSQDSNTSVHIQHPVLHLAS